MTNTSSDFGKELDSLADVITFGVAPALLAYMWGFHLLPPLANPEFRTKLGQFGAIASFLFLMAGASRLARFNIQVNPQPSNPGRPDKKYFVGMPIPAGAGVIAAVVHFTSGDPLISPWMAITWLLMVLAVGYLMVSTWRFYSFKDIHFSSRQPFRIMLLLAVVFVSIWFYSRWVLFRDCNHLHVFRSAVAAAVDHPPPSPSHPRRRCTRRRPSPHEYSLQTRSDVQRGRRAWQRIPRSDRGREFAQGERSCGSSRTIAIFPPSM